MSRSYPKVQAHFSPCIWPMLATLSVVSIALSPFQDLMFQKAYELFTLEKKLGPL